MGRLTLAALGLETMRENKPCIVLVCHLVCMLEYVEGL